MTSYETVDFKTSTSSSSFFDNTQFFKINTRNKSGATAAEEGEFSQEELNTIFDSVNWDKKDQLDETSPLLRGTFDLKEYCSLLSAIKNGPEDGIISIVTPQIIQEYIHRYGNKSMDTLIRKSIKNLACEWIRAFIENESIRNILDWKEITKAVFKVDSLNPYPGRHHASIHIGSSDEFNSMYKGVVELLLENRKKIDIRIEFMLQCLHEVSDKNRLYGYMSSVDKLYNSIRDSICSKIIVTTISGHTNIPISEALNEPVTKELVIGIIRQVPQMPIIYLYIIDKLNITQTTADKLEFLKDVTEFRSLYKNSYIVRSITNKDTGMLYKYCKMFVNDTQSATELVFKLCTKWPEAVDECIEYAKKNNIGIQWGDCTKYITTKHF